MEFRVEDAKCGIVILGNYHQVLVWENGLRHPDEYTMLRDLWCNYESAQRGNGGPHLWSSPPQQPPVYPQPIDLIGNWYKSAGADALLRFP